MRTSICITFLCEKLYCSDFYSLLIIQKINWFLINAYGVKDRTGLMHIYIPFHSAGYSYNCFGFY